MEMENIEQKKILSFGKILMIISALLLCICIFYWIKLSSFIDEFEQTLNIEQPSVVEHSVEEVEVVYLNDQEEIEFFMNLAVEVAESYAQFTSADLKFNDIKNYFQEDSEILELLESYNSNRYNNHENSYFENIEVLKPSLTNDSLVKCQVSFDYIVITSQDTHNYPSSYTLYFNQKTKKVTALEMN